MVRWHLTFSYTLDTTPQKWQTRFTVRKKGVFFGSFSCIDKVPLAQWINQFDDSTNIGLSQRNALLQYNTSKDKQISIEFW